MVKCKLRYLTIIGKSNQDLLEKVQAYFQAKNAGPVDVKVVSLTEEEKKEEGYAEKNP